MKNKCTACALGKGCSAKVNASEGWGNPKAKLVIVLDAPGDVMAERLLIWILRKLSLTDKDVWIDYLFKCPLPEKRVKGQAKELLSYYKICWNKYKRNEILNNHTLLLCGNNSVSFLTEQKMKEVHGRKAETDAWCVYSFNYLLMNPAECVNTWRVIFCAAVEAGLSPKMKMNEPMFRFPSKKLR